MAEKIKITRKEVDDIYDIEEPKEEAQPTEANATFEEFTEYYDEKELKERKQDD